MIRRVRRVVGGVVLFTAAMAASGLGQARTPEVSDRVFEALVLARLSAFSTGDSKSYLSMLADDFVHISDSGVRRERGAIAEYVRAHGGVGSSVAYRVEELQWRWLGEAVLVDCVIVEHSASGSGRFRESNVFRREDGRWLYAYHQETTVVERPEAIQIDPAVLGDYEGRYDFGAGMQDTVTLRAGALYVSDGTHAARLLPIAPDTFSVEGAGGVLVFVRDRDGRVMGEVYVPLNGKVVSSTRLP